MNEIAQNQYGSVRKTQPVGILLPKLFLILTIVFLLWIVIVASGALVLEMGPYWAGLSLGMWAIVVSVLVALFIILDIVFLLKPELGYAEAMEFVETTENKHMQYHNGKRIYEFTFPVHAKGGVFSKTYLQVEDDFYLRIRNQMFTKEDFLNESFEDQSSSSDE